MNFKNNKKKDVKASSIINSAALQDHLLKKLNFNIDFDFNLSKKIPQKRKTLEKLPYLNKRMEKEIQKLEIIEKKNILPFESEALKKLKQAKSDDQKMFSYNKKLTWAQKLGLVDAPPLPLTAKDWEEIEQKSKIRNDSENCCSICLEDFKIEPQIILSCSHVFHMKCLNSYQNHNKVKCCPICRRKDYEKKVIDEAIKAFTFKSIIRIQRTYRGSRDRIKLYKSLIDQSYVAKSVRFNRRLIGYKMWKLSNRIKDKVKQKELYFNNLFNKMQLKHQEDKEAILDEIVEVQRKKLMNEASIESYLQRLGIKRQQKKSLMEPSNWQVALQKATSRKEDQCSICLMGLWNKPVYLLSCTHLFHVNCVQGFERYAIPGNTNKCPCCRSHYEKKEVTSQFKKNSQH